MGARIIYKIGQRISGSRLKYMGDIEDKPIRICRFICDCGQKIERPLSWVRHGNTSSCGCFRREETAKKNFKHGNAKTNNPSGAYRSWHAMHQRVIINPKYKNRKICKRWCGENGFKNFLKDMGERPPKHSTERIDNNKGYSPSNCKWAIKAEQARNTSAVKFIEYEGTTYKRIELLQKFGISYGLYKQRVRNGMMPLQAIITPINKSKSHRRKK